MALDAEVLAGVRSVIAPEPVKRQTHKDLKAIVDAIDSRDARRAEELVSDHLMRTLATINIWQ